MDTYKVTYHDNGKEVFDYTGKGRSPIVVMCKAEDVLKLYDFLDTATGREIKVVKVDE